MTKPKIQIIIGSTRPGRVGEPLGQWFSDIAAQNQNAEFEVLDLAEWNLPLLNEPIPARSGKYQHEHTLKWSQKIQEADGYIIITPEYNHGYPAALKNALDYLFHEWHGKSVAIVSYGLQPGGGVRAAQQLHQVVVELGMRPLTQDLNMQIDRNEVSSGNLIPRLATYEAAAKEIVTEVISSITAKETVSNN